MAGSTLTTANAALREFYLGGAQNQLNDDIPFLNQIEKNTKDIEGRRAVLAPHVSRNSGVGARAEGGTLPTAGSQGYAEERVPLKYNYGRGQISGPSIRAMRSDRGSFVRQTTSEMDRLTTDLKREVSRQLWMNADGKIATCTTTTASTTVNLATTTTTVQMRFFAVGDLVDIGTVASPQTVIAGTAITAVDTTNLTITIGTAVTTSSSHFVFRAGNNIANATNEVTGMQAIVASSGTLFNVNPSTYGSWVSRVDSPVGSLSENKMAQHVQNVQILSGMYPKLFIADDGSFRAYGALLTSLKRSNNTTQLDGGYSGLSFDAAGSKMNVVWDRDAPYGCMFSVNPDHLQEFRMANWDFMQEDGAILSRVSGVDGYEFVLFMYHELATDRRNSSGLMSGITTA